MPLNPDRQREPFKLPVTDVNDRRSKLAERYAKMVQQMYKVENIIPVLKNFYDQAYNNGLKDMDAMHVEAEK